MSKIDEMIAELCPSGVEYKRLGDISTIGGGHTPSKNDPQNYDDGHIPWVTSKDVKVEHLNTTGVLITKKGAQALTLYPEKTIVVVLRSGILKHTFPVAMLDVPMTINQDIKAVNPTKDSGVDSKYLFYCIKNAGPTLLSIGRRSGGTVDSIPLADFKATEIPIPPIEIQKEIVRILDKFAELEAELEARKAQYAYYRARLIDETRHSSLTPLGNIAKSLDSKRIPIKQSERKPGPFPYYGASGIVDHVDDYLFNGDYLLVSEDGANLLARTYPIAFQVSGKTWINNHAHVLQIEESTTRRYVEIYLNQLDLSGKINVSGQPKLTKKNLLAIEIPLPSLHAQQKIVDILDRFDALTTSLTDGLPAEIEARRQQYEHYRDKLLNFPRKETATLDVSRTMWASIRPALPPCSSSAVAKTVGPNGSPRTVERSQWFTVMHKDM